MEAKKQTLEYVFAIAKYLYFNVEIDQEVEVKKLAKPENEKKFHSALQFLIDRNMFVLGGFQVKYIDETRSSIKKVAHLFIDVPSPTSEHRFVVPVENYKKDKETEKPLVKIEPYYYLFDHDEKKIKN